MNLHPLNALAERILQINVANGWDVLEPADWADDWKVPGKLALLHSEVSEALEEFRRNRKETFTEEMADVFIRGLDICAGLEIDIVAAIEAKIAQNRERDHRHGGKRI